MSSKRRGGEHRPKRYAKRAEKIRLRPRRKTPESRNFAVRNPAPTKPRKVPVKRHGIDEYRSHNRVRKPEARVENRLRRSYDRYCRRQHQRAERAHSARERKRKPHKGNHSERPHCRRTRPARANVEVERGQRNERLKAPPYADRRKSNLDNLKSNTMKNTVQKYEIYLFLVYRKQKIYILAVIFYLF